MKKINVCQLTEQGMAVIMAVLTVAIVASISSFLLWQQNLMLRAVANQREQNQLYQVEVAILEYAKEILREDANYGAADHYGELWATVGMDFTVEDWRIAGKIADATAQFNVNNLINPNGTANASGIEQYRRLLEILELPSELSDTLVDWLDADEVHFSASGAEDSDYLLMRPPYRTANQPMADISNLARVKGYTPDVIEKLKPFLIALPSTTTVNINTASAEVIAAVIPGMAIDDARSFVLSRDRAPLHSIREIDARFPNRSINIPTGVLSIGTDFFLVDGVIRSPSARRHIQILLYRPRHGYSFILWRRQL